MKKNSPLLVRIRFNLLIGLVTERFSSKDFSSSKRLELRDLCYIAATGVPVKIYDLQPISFPSAVFYLRKNLFLRVENCAAYRERNRSNEQRRVC